MSTPLSKFVAVRTVPKAHPFHGINRKVQIKPTAWRSAAEAGEGSRREGNRAGGAPAEGLEQGGGGEQNEGGDDKDSGAPEGASRAA